MNSWHVIIAFCYANAAAVTCRSSMLFGSLDLIILYINTQTFLRCIEILICRLILILF